MLPPPAHICEVPDYSAELGHSFLETVEKDQ